MPLIPQAVSFLTHVQDRSPHLFSLMTFKRARTAGITLKSDPHDTEWNSRAFEVSDPSGFLLTVFSEASA